MKQMVEVIWCLVRKVMLVQNKKLGLLREVKSFHLKNSGLGLQVSLPSDAFLVSIVAEARTTASAAKKIRAKVPCKTQLGMKLGNYMACQEMILFWNSMQTRKVSRNPGKDGIDNARQEWTKAWVQEPHSLKPPVRTVLRNICENSPKNMLLNLCFRFPKHQVQQL